MSIRRWLGKSLARYLSQTSDRWRHPPQCTPEQLTATLQKGDILLVDGHSRFGISIKYLTHSTWSHAALFVGDALGPPAPGEKPKVFVEVDINEGVRGVTLDNYAKLRTRICRPCGLSTQEIDQVVGYAVMRLGHQYDLQNVFDLVRYLIRKPPVPDAWKLRLLKLGSGEPTRAICSTLIARAFHSINYPILPEEVTDPPSTATGRRFRKRHHRLFTPSDFDLSPYFQVVKPVLDAGFDPHGFAWGGDAG